MQLSATGVFVGSYESPRALLRPALGRLVCLVRLVGLVRLVSLAALVRPPDRDRSLRAAARSGRPEAPPPTAAGARTARADRLQAGRTTAAHRAGRYRQQGGRDAGPCQSAAPIAAAYPGRRGRAGRPAAARASRRFAAAGGPHRHRRLPPAASRTGTACPPRPLVTGPPDIGVRTLGRTPPAAAARASAVRPAARTGTAAAEPDAPARATVPDDTPAWPPDWRTRRRRRRVRDAHLSAPAPPRCPASRPGRRGGAAGALRVSAAFRPKNAWRRGPRPLRTASRGRRTPRRRGRTGVCRWTTSASRRRPV